MSSFTRSFVLAAASCLALSSASFADEPGAREEAATPRGVELAAGDALGLEVFADRQAEDAAKPLGLANANGVPRPTKR